MEQRLSLITIGVYDLKAMTDFYETKFGWQKMDSSNDHISFFKLNPHYALENLLRTKNTANQPLHFVIFSNHSGAMLFESNILIYCVFDSHYKVLMHNAG